MLGGREGERRIGENMGSGGKEMEFYSIKDEKKDKPRRRWRRRSKKKDIKREEGVDSKLLHGNRKRKKRIREREKKNIVGEGVLDH